MSKKIQPMSRRTVLKGLGVSMCLPLLEAMGADVAGAEERNKSKGKTPAAQRLAVLYMPNGVNPHAWTPTGAGNSFELSPILKPLESLKSEILVLTELMNQQSIEGDGHYAKVAPFLTGTHITKTTGSNLRCGGVSLDQAYAEMAASIAAGRLGTPEEFGAACVFLCSAHTSFVSGQNLQIDGGSYPGVY